jgi:signal transduction histidine kinase
LPPDYSLVLPLNLQLFEWVIENLVKNAVDAMTRQGKITIDIIEDCYIYADKKQMLRVFNNLIKNSIQAISNKKDGEILISLFRENDFCIITFKDNGIGIDTSLQSRIFSPYFTTKSGGTGLGLAMVKNIIESMDGKIWFESEKESGTTFFIQLKLYIE